MSSTPDSGQSLAQRDDALPGAPVPERAGAIVAEVITSIAEEAQSRATEMEAQAEAEANEQRANARQGVDAVRSRLDAIAEHIGRLRSGLREEEERLTTGLRRIGSGEVRPVLPAAEPKPEPETPSPQAAEVPPAQDDAEGEPIQDVEVVEHPADDREATREFSAASDEPGEKRDMPIAPDDVRTRIAAMGDRELARTYVDALDASSERTAAGMDPSRADGVAAAVVEEALTRPAFSDMEAGGGGLRGRLGRIAGGRAQTAMERLREAAQGARQQSRGS